MASYRHLLGASLLITAYLSSAVTALPSARRNLGTYELVDSWQGQNFFNGFDFFTGEDPTKGFVTYVDQGAAQGDNLIGITPGGSVYIGVDHTSILNPNGAGRKSVRIESKKSYDYGLFIVDLNHMPGTACGSWPAFWTYGPNWPENGEIDIIESVNLIANSQIVLHTEGSCSVSAQPMTGSLISTQCGSVAGTEGCLVNAGSGTCGTPFNAAGGGVYAMEWTKSHIAIWHFPRGAIPESITSNKPDVSTFGTPKALFKGSCIFDDHFRTQRVVFDTTFCGDWAGTVFAESGCPMDGSGDHKQSCHNYVASHPSDYKESYWEVNSLKIYQGGANATLEVSSAAVASTVALKGSSTPLAASATGFSVGAAKQTAAVTQTNVQGAQATVAAASRHLTSEESSIDVVPVAEANAAEGTKTETAEVKTLVRTDNEVTPSVAAAHVEATEISSDSNATGLPATTVTHAPAATQKSEADIDDGDETSTGVAAPQESNSGALSLEHGVVPSDESDDDEQDMTDSQTQHHTDDESESESETASGVAATHSSAAAETNNEDDDGDGDESDSSAAGASSHSTSSDDSDDDQDDSNEIHVVPAAVPSNFARTPSGPNDPGVPAAATTATTPSSGVPGSGVVAANPSGAPGSAAAVTTHSSNATSSAATFSLGVTESSITNAAGAPGSAGAVSAANPAAVGNTNGAFASTGGAVNATGAVDSSITASAANAATAANPNDVAGSAAGAANAAGVVGTGAGAANPAGAPAPAAAIAPAASAASPSGLAAASDGITLTVTGQGSAQTATAVAAAATVEGSLVDSGNAGNNGSIGNTGQAGQVGNVGNANNTGNAEQLGQTGSVLPASAADPNAANPPPPAGSVHPPACCPGNPPAGGSGNPPAGGAASPSADVLPNNTTAITISPQTTLADPLPGGQPSGAHVGSPIHTAPAPMTTHPTPSPSLPVVIPPPVHTSPTVIPTPSFGPVPTSPAANTSPMSPEPTTPVITGGHTSPVVVVPPGPGPNTNTATMATEPSPTHPGPTAPLFTGAANKISFHARNIIGTAAVALLNSHVLLNIFH